MMARTNTDMRALVAQWAKTTNRPILTDLLADLANAEARAERAERFAAAVADMEDADDVRAALTDWDHADVYRALADMIVEARKVTGGMTVFP